MPRLLKKALKHILANAKENDDNDFLDIPVRRQSPSRRFSTGGGTGMKRSNSNASLNSTTSVRMDSTSSCVSSLSGSSIGGGGGGGGGNISVTASLKRSLSSAGLRMSSSSRRSLSSQNLKNMKKKVACKLR